MTIINQQRGVEILSKGEDTQGAFYTVNLLTTDRMTKDGRLYTGDLKHLSRGIRRMPHIFCELDPYHDYRFTQRHRSEESMISAITTIESNNVCAAITDIRLNEKAGTLGAVIRPWGPHAANVRDLMEAPNVNVVFGMRAITSADGKIDKIVTWDLLPE